MLIINDFALRSVSFSCYKTKGSIETWKEKIGEFASKNPNIIFTIALALSAPLLHLVGEENIGIHFIGPSSIGKTTLLHVVSSVWGNSIYNWRTTDNAAESIAETSNDGLLLLDELGQVDGYALDQLSYMLGNGKGKLRAKRSGDAKDAKTFRLVLLSSGESGLSSKLKERGKTVKAGQSVRFLEIPMQEEFGIFECLHHFKNGDEFSRYLKDSSKENCGTLIDAFLEEIILKKTEIIEMIQVFRKAWEKEMRSIYAEIDGQVQRVIGKFSQVAACGEVAIFLKLLPLEKLEVSDVCKNLLNRWIGSRGGILPQEVIEAVKGLQEFIEEHGSSRFENPWESGDRRVVCNRAGFRRLNEDGLLEYYILPGVFGNIMGSANRAEVCDLLIKRGALYNDIEGKCAKSIRVPGLGQTRVYHIDAQKLLEIFK